MVGRLVRVMASEATAADRNSSRQEMQGTIAVIAWLFATGLTSAAGGIWYDQHGNMIGIEGYTHRDTRRIL